MVERRCIPAHPAREPSADRRSHLQGSLALFLDKAIYLRFYQFLYARQAIYLVL